MAPRLRKLLRLRRWTRQISNDYPRRSSTSKRSLLFASAVVSIPLLLITAVLLLFVFRNLIHVTTKSDLLPSDAKKKRPRATYYYSQVDVSKILVAGSWAVLIAQWVLGSFMFIFSYKIAQEILEESEKEPLPGYFRQIMRGDPNGLWPWIIHFFSRLPFRRRKSRPAARYVHLAVLSFFLACCIS